MVQQNDLHISTLFGAWLIQIGEDKDAYSIHVYEELATLLRQEAQGEPLDFENFENFEAACLCGLECGNRLTVSPLGLMISKMNGTSRFAEVDPRKTSAIHRVAHGEIGVMK